MKVWIRGEITADTAFSFVARVEGCQDDEIEVLVDSAGGDAVAAFSMAAALVRSEVPSAGTLLRADSAALVAGIGCGKRTAARDASALLHDATIEIPKATSVTATVLYRGTHARPDHLLDGRKWRVVGRQIRGLDFNIGFAEGDLLGALRLHGDQPNVPLVPFHRIGNLARRGEGHV